jgi:hypothetical protein
VLCLEVVTFLCQVHDQLHRAESRQKGMSGLTSISLNPA